ncbi:MAG: FHA domain-containing protein [Microbacteriaceae bacterium]|nr:FHA domain-containing protein [Microbacteriaceae bacterium]
MSRERPPAYPVIHVNVLEDGSATANVAGEHRTFPDDVPERTRDRVIRYAVEVAERMHRGVRMTIAEGGGEYQLAVYPDGEVTQLEDTPSRRRSKAQATVAVSPAPPRPAPLPDPAERFAIAPPPVEPRRGASAVLRFSTGDTAEIRYRAIIGRQPDAAPDVDGWQLVEVRDITKTMSRVHAEVEFRTGTLWLTDRGSGNGTKVRRGTKVRAVPAGIRVDVAAGDVIELGSQVTCTIDMKESS